MAEFGDGSMADLTDAPEGWNFWSGIDWVIVGGESGPHARPMHPDWARTLRDQCNAANVPFFFKQWGEWVPKMLDGDDSLSSTVMPHRSPTNGFPMHMVKVGKHAAGHLLDGIEHHAFPEPRPLNPEPSRGARA
jgi:hypothetical protein